MIEWKEYPDFEPDYTNRMLLITNGTNVVLGYHALTLEGYKWFTMQDEVFEGVTHFTDFNFPSKTA